MNNDSRKNIIKLIIVFLLFFKSSIITKLFMYMFGIRKLNNHNYTILYTLTYIVLLIIFFLIYKKELISEWKKFKKNAGENIDIGFKYWTIGIFSMVGSNILINIIFGSGQANNEQAVQSMISSLPILMLITAGIIGPIIEEIVFRKSLRSVIKKPWIFILTSSLLFGFVHVSSADSIKQMLYIIPYGSLGLAFSLAYYKSDNIYTSIIMHQFHNIVLTLISILF